MKIIMKKFLTIFLLFSLLFSLLFTWVFADNSTNYTSKRVYPNSVDFLKAEWNVCLWATDWCNTSSIIDWKIYTSTKMYCEDIYGNNWQEKWSCTQYRDGYILPDTDGLMCTMQYAPVCAEVQVKCINAPCPPIQQTFWNSCTAGKNKILYGWECDPYVDIDLYNRYLLNESFVLEKISVLPEDTLNLILELIESFIPRAKLLNIIPKINDSFIKAEVTKYVFLKNTILKFLSIEKVSIWTN